MTTEWKRATEEGVELWRHADGQVIAGSIRGVMAILGGRVHKFVRGERALLELLAQVCNKEVEGLLLEAWSAHVRARISREMTLFDDSARGDGE